MVRGYLVVLLAAVLVINSNAKASPLDADRVLEKLAALEARVATLEAKNQQYKRELLEARTGARASSLKTYGAANAPVVAKAPASVQPDRTADTGWTGVFWGASAGGAVTRSSTVSNERAIIAAPGFLTGTDASAITGPTGNSGGFVDLFVGSDLQLSRFVVGGQLESTVSDLNFASSGSRSYSYFGTSGQAGETGSGNYRPQVSSRWMASALLRAGVLLDEHTLLYGLGGWTLAQFEARNLTDNPFFQPNETFMASGPTGGVGIERKLDSNWRVRAEYRYTRFDTAHSSEQSSFVTSFNNIETYARQTKFDQSMQSGRIGIAYSFNPTR